MFTSFFYACREVDHLTRGYVNDLEFKSVVVNHLAAVEDRIKEVRQRLPDEGDACGEYEAVARGELPRRLDLVR